MNAFDRVIGYFAPQLGVKRARARHATRIYEGASVGRRASAWKTLHTSANAEIQLAIRPLRDRARDLVRNTPHAPRMLDILVSHTVGNGIVPVCATGIDRLDLQVMQLWNDWSSEADISGQLNFYALQALAVRSMIESGEVVQRFIDVPIEKGAAVPTRLQLLESDYIDQFRDGIFGDPRADSKDANNRLTRSRLGVGLGDFDRRVGLWLWPYHPGEITTLNMRPLISTFVPSAELVHMFKVLRPGQVRGVPWFTPMLTTARELADFLDAVNVKARIEACLAGFIINDDPLGVPLIDPSREGINQTLDTANPEALVTTLEPGMLKELKAGQDIKFSRPSGTTQIEPILLHNLQAMAAAGGCTYDQATGDLRQANYSSLRAGKLDFWRLISQLQTQTVIPMLCEPTWKRFISRAVLAGRLRPRSDGYPCQWVTPAREAVDPKKDLDAEIHEVRAGRITPQRFIASKGGNWRTTVPEFAQFFALLDKLGVRLDIDPRFTDQQGRQPAGQGGAPVEPTAKPGGDVDVDPDDDDQDTADN